MTSLPAKVYLTRKDVALALGGRRQLEKAEAAGHIHRVPLPGYTIAHYRRAEVATFLAVHGGETFSGRARNPLDHS